MERVRVALRKALRARDKLSEMMSAQPMKWLRRWLGISSPPAPLEEVLPLPSEPVIVSTAPVPAFIKPVARARQSNESPPHEHATCEDQDRDPGRALGRIRSRAPGGSPGRRASTWAAADEAESLTGGLGVLPELARESLPQEPKTSSTAMEPSTMPSLIPQQAG